jgi:signal transduction histidine kinase
VGAGKTVVIDAACDDVAFMSDPTLLGRVIGNLVKNALEATGEGGTVILDCFHTGSRVEFSVHNNGLIPHDAQLQIFQRSFTTKGAGRGLGTFGARMLTERYLNGDIAFESNEDDGTTFTVSYPFITPVDDGRP